MIPDILIPSIKSDVELAPLVCEMQGFSMDNRIITTGLQESASVNRNRALERAKSEIIIMIDDDIAGFFPGWWETLISPLEEDESIVFVSARLMTVDGNLGAMMFGSGNTSQRLESVPAAPTACCAFRNDGTRFDEGFIYSGFEDTYFCQCLTHKYKNSKVVINNECKIVHLNEMKGQGKGYEHNKAHYEKLLFQNGWRDFV